MGISRITERFAGLKVANRSAFITYVMGGDPDLETSYEILKGLPEAGADLIELGFPFSDPMAEGPTIQLAAERSLAAGTKMAMIFELVHRFRQNDKTTPIILMGYMNPLESMGPERFAYEAARAGADGAIIVDCPPEEAGAIHKAFAAHDLAFIRLITPTSDTERLAKLVENTSGFLYYVSVAGVTGVKSADPAAIAPNIEAVRLARQLPVAVGFGIKTPDQAAAIAKIADGVVVGSVLVEAIKLSLPANGGKTDEIVTKVLEKCAVLAHSVHSARIET